jgi:UDP-glucose 4-epimerase
LRVLVTGASGHVGGAIAQHLLASGHEVVGLSRRLTKESRLLSSALAADVGRDGLAETLVSQQPRCDAIVHAAAALDKEPFAPAISVTNGVGTQQILHLAQLWQVERFVFISGVTVIGRPRRLPITERHPTAPLTAYHASKLYGEHLTAVAAGGGLPAVSLRLTAPVGPGMPGDRILSVFVRRALGGEPLELAGQGTRMQDYVDVRDVARATEAALGRRVTGVLNIGSGRCVSNLELAQQCVSVTGSGSEVRLSGTEDREEGTRWEVSLARARKAIDYAPGESLESSIAAVAQDIARSRG